MSAETQVYDLLRNDAGVVAIVGDRIHHKFVPLAPPPAKTPSSIAYIRSATEYTNTIHQISQVAENVSIDIHCIAASDAAAVALADAVALIPMVKLNRFDEYDPETEIHSTTITVQVWNA
jgi:hypothetical protein